MPAARPIWDAIIKACEQLLLHVTQLLASSQTTYCLQTRDQRVPPPGWQPAYGEDHGHWYLARPNRLLMLELRQMLDRVSCLRQSPDKEMSCPIAAT